MSMWQNGQKSPKCCNDGAAWGGKKHPLFWQLLREAKDATL